MRALEDVVRAGKVIYPAVSNWSAWQTQRARSTSRSATTGRACRSIQPMYSLVKRQAEVEILPMAQAQRHRRHPLQPGRRRACCRASISASADRAGCKTNKMYEARYGDAWMFEVAEKYVAFCKERGLHPVSAAIAWVGAHPAVTAPIIGARNLDQLQGLRSTAVKIDMTPALRAEIADALAHAAAGDRPAGGAEDRAGLVFAGGAPLQWRVMSCHSDRGRPARS